jgi:acetyl-CoA carboxylase biotin carboxyl carrier protein
MALTFKDVAEILRIIDASQCEEVVIELEGLRLVVRRGHAHGAGTHDGRSLPIDTPGDTSAHAGSANARVPRAPRSFGRAHAELSPAEGRIGVRAPMVGSFYRRPSPQEEPFVEVGQRVKTGDPLCLIEVMKLYTTISSPGDGIIEAIAAEDASAVEFDQLLFVIKPD